MRPIKYCQCGKRCEGTLDVCASCNRLERKAASLPMPSDPEPINKVSCSHRKMLEKYNKKRKMWIRGKKCGATFPHDCTKDKDLTTHHMQGRVGYADEYARENDIPLLLDERFWLPVCLDAHQYIEANPKFAWENQYSFKRVTDPIFQKRSVKQ
jgi:hypothetical protein